MNPSTFSILPWGKIRVLFSAFYVHARELGPSKLLLENSNLSSPLSLGTMAYLKKHPYEPLTGPSQIRILRLFAQDSTAIPKEKIELFDGRTEVLENNTVVSGKLISVSEKKTEISKGKTYVDCQLQHISLDEANLTQDIIYYALSYTWLDDDASDDILLDGR